VPAALRLPAPGANPVAGKTKPPIRAWDLATGRERATLNDLGRPFQRLCLSADGRWLAGGEPYTAPQGAGGWSGEVRVWDLSTGKAVVSVDATAAMFHDACVSPDGKAYVWIAGR